MNKIERLYFNILCYGILVVFSPFMLLAQLLDSFVRFGVDVWYLHRFIGEKRAAVEARIARAKA